MAVVLTFMISCQKNGFGKACATTSLRLTWELLVVSNIKIKTTEIIFFTFSLFLYIIPSNIYRNIRVFSSYLKKATRCFIAQILMIKSYNNGSIRYTTLKKK